MKKLNKFVAVLVALAMMASLAVTMAFAREDPAVTVYFTKTYSTNKGTVAPAQEFSFTVTQDKEAGVSNEAKIEGQKLSFAQGNATKTLQSADLLAGQDWTNADGKVVPGVYVYTVKETIPDSIDGYTKEDGNVFTKETKTQNEKVITTGTLTYSEKEYTLKVWVNAKGEVEGAYVYDDKTNKKVTSDPEKDSDGNVKANGFNFTNTYSEKVETTPQGSDPTKDKDGDVDGSTAYVQKTVTAEKADQIDANQAFNFEIVVTFPDIDAQDEYTAKVVDATGTAVDPAQTLTFDKEDTESLTQTFKLRHGDRLVFENIDIGATFKAYETDTFKAGDDYSYTKGNMEDATTITSAKNSATIINNYEKSSTVPDSGIIISNLPYIVLALVAVGGLVAYVVVRRKADEEA